jgi:hypothetical protein
MQLPTTPDNIAWAAAVRSRVNAEATMVGAKAALWRFGGYGLFATGIGAGLGIAAGLGFLGYSYVTDNEAAATKIADAISMALHDEPIKTEGTVRIADGSQVELKPGGEVVLKPGGDVSLKPGATVRLDPAASVRLDPAATVRLDGRLPAGGRTQTPEQMASAIRATADTVTNYVIFTDVPFGGSDGVVESGAHFKDNRQGGGPDYQFCHYKEALSATRHALIDLGWDGQAVEPESPPATLDVAAARKLCHWMAARG